MRARGPAHVILPLAAAALAAFATVGADARWLAAVGALVEHGRVPRALPFATAPTPHWHDVPVLAELIFHWLVAAFGNRGLVAAQVGAAAVGFGALAAGLRRQSTPVAALVAGCLVVLGSLAEVLIVRNELFSLALLPVLLLVLETAPGRLWVTLPLLAVWSNLHGSVLVGLVLVWLVVALERRDAWPVAVAAPFAVCVTPQLWRTPLYYWDVQQNQAAKLGAGLWAPFGSSALDVPLALAALLLGAAALARRRPWRPWEIAAVVLLAAATIHAARFGTWLLFVLAYPAARGLEFPQKRGLPAVVVALPVAAVVAGLAQPHADRAPRLVGLVVRSHAAVLAEPVLAEEVEVHHGLVWVADPIDAFRRADQRSYIEWTEGKPSGRAAVAHARWVLVDATTDAGRAAARDPRLRLEAREGTYALYGVRSQARR